MLIIADKKLTTKEVGYINDFIATLGKFNADEISHFVGQIHLCVNVKSNTGTLSKCTAVGSKMVQFAYGDKAVDAYVSKYCKEGTREQRLDLTVYGLRKNSGAAGKSRKPKNK